MDRDRLHELIERVKGTTVGVIGDLCLDAYWTLDVEYRELSVETSKPVHRVEAQRYSLGGGANVVANLAALGVGSVKVFGVVGDDMFGREMVRRLDMLEVDSSGIVVQEDAWDTTVYTKPLIGDEEHDRFDYGTANRISPETEQTVISNLDAAAANLDVLIVNQQVPHGYHSDTVIEYLNRLAEQKGGCRVLVDSRHKSGRFKRAILKVNAVEAAVLCGERAGPAEVVPVADLKRYVESVFQSSGAPVFVTRGDRGIVVYDGTRFCEVPGVQVLRQTDPVGAGDTVSATIAAVLSAGGSIEEAARVANFAASVTVQKLKETGTASPPEILAVGSDPDYIFRPELADDIRRAQYLPDLDIEIISTEIPRGRIAHALFDNDGTVSTLRQGWEEVMEPVWIRAVLGDHYDRATTQEYRRVADVARGLIDRSTGVQTIVQMEMLVEAVRDAGFVPDEKVLDARGYKEIYNDALMELINRRIGRIRRGELDAGDWTVKGAVPFLRALRDRGVNLYLASGTDEHDVVNESAVLGYADLFDGRIFGAVGDVSKYSKKMVIDRIIDEHALSGPELVCFGDGPVELRETKKRGGIAVGIASDEIRRHGLNAAKRTRLVRAGADLIAPDFSQARHILDYLFESP